MSRSGVERPALLLQEWSDFSYFSLTPPFGSGAMPHAFKGVRRSVGLFKRLGPRSHVVGSLARVSAPHETVSGSRASPSWMVRKLAEQWLEKSGDFCVGLWWSVDRHRLLRSRCIHSRRRWSTRLSAVVLIAFWGESIDAGSSMRCAESRLVCKLRSCGDT